MLAADRAASAPARRLQLQCPQTLAVLSGSGARIALAEDRGPAGEELAGGGGGEGQRLQLQGQGVGKGDSSRSLGELLVHRDTPHRARAVCREETPVGREAATAATGA